MMSARISVFRKRTASATFIDLDLPDLRAALEEMEPHIPALSGRVDEILGAPVQDHERPTR